MEGKAGGRGNRQWRQGQADDTGRAHNRVGRLTGAAYLERRLEDLFVQEGRILSGSADMGEPTAMIKDRSYAFVGRPNVDAPLMHAHDIVDSARRRRGGAGQAPSLPHISTFPLLEVAGCTMPPNERTHRDDRRHAGLTAGCRGAGRGLPRARRCEARRSASEPRRHYRLQHSSKFDRRKSREMFSWFCSYFPHLLGLGQTAALKQG